MGLLREQRYCISWTSAQRIHELCCSMLTRATCHTDPIPGICHQLLLSGCVSWSCLFFMSKLPVRADCTAIARSSHTDEAISGSTEYITRSETVCMMKHGPLVDVFIESNIFARQELLLSACSSSGSYIGRQPQGLTSIRHLVQHPTSTNHSPLFSH